jgi:hypothetical protein
MTTHTLAQTLTNVRQMIGRYAGWLGLSLVIAVVALAAYRYTTVPAISVPEVSNVRAPVVRLDPAQQSVLDYLRAHDAVETRPLDPTTQSVLDYLRAHRAVETQPLDPTQQSVIDYLRAHSR